MSSIALVTGANRGLGRATAIALAQAGHHVVIAGRNVSAIECLAQELRADGLAAESLQLDVTDRDSITRAAQTLAERHGRLDLLVNNAGLLPEATVTTQPAFVDADALIATLQTNVVGVALVLEAFTPLLRRSESGRVVNVSSRMGSLADQLDETSLFHGMVLPAYQASKAAVNSLTAGLSKHLAADGVRVVSVCPGFVQTELTPMNADQAPLTAEQAAKTVLGALDASTGTFVDSDGVVPW